MGMRVDLLTAVRSTLLADTGPAGVYTLTGGRVHNFEIPQEPAFPYLVYTLDGAEADPDQPFRRHTRAFTVSFIIVDDLKKDFGAVAAIADAVDAIMREGRIVFASPASFRVSLAEPAGEAQAADSERPTYSMQYRLTVDSIDQFTPQAPI